MTSIVQRNAKLISINFCNSRTSKAKVSVAWEKRICETCWLWLNQRALVIVLKEQKSEVTHAEWVMRMIQIVVAIIRTSSKRFFLWEDCRRWWNGKIKRMREEKKFGTLNDQEAKILLACLRNNQNQGFRQEEERNEFAFRKHENSC